MNALSIPSVEIRGPLLPAFSEVLTPEALGFVSKLCQIFSKRRLELLQRRVEIQAKIDAGSRPDFLAETERVRRGPWKIAPIPKDLFDRRVEITGPVDRKMIINALNSGAKIFMADFEDANCPTWENVIQGQINLKDAVRGTISYTGPEGKHYKLNENVATLIVRPRGWHLFEKHALLNGGPVSASLFDFGLFFYHNAKASLAKGTGPYFYLPKLENHLEARLWNDVFVWAQKEIGLPEGTIKATVLIENILAAFEMEEILYELRNHCVGLNCGRWDYIFSFIKKFRSHKNFLLPDRATVTMERPFLKSYVDLLIQTCHRRGAHAIGGMAAWIPIKNDAAANEAAIRKVTADKEREVKAGHDGTWVAHPGLVPVAMQVFDRGMPTPNQLQNLKEDIKITARDLLQVPEGTITLSGLRTNVNVGILYLESWLRGSGCVPLYNLMEDAATAEISRAQVWQWIHHEARSAEGQTITKQFFQDIVKEELTKIREMVGSQKFTSGKFSLANELFVEMATSNNFIEFLTLPAYEYV